MKEIEKFFKSPIKGLRRHWGNPKFGFVLMAALFAVFAIGSLCDGAIHSFIFGSGGTAMALMVVLPAPAFNAAPAAGATITLDVPIREPKRIHGIALRFVGYSNTNAKLIASAVVSKIRVIVDTEEKMTIKPALLRKFEEFFNANADTMDVSEIFIPFSHHLDPTRGWGLAQIGEILINVEFVNPLPANTTVTDVQAKLIYVPLQNHVPRGDVYVTRYFTQANPIDQWNEIPDLKYNEVVAVSHLYFDHAGVTEVEAWLGSKKLWHATKEEILFYMQKHPIYRQPSGVSHVVIAGQATTSAGGLFVPFDLFGQMAESFPLFADGARQDFKLKYKLENALVAAAPFDLMAQAIERDSKVYAQSASTKA
jgi:hypothetical protein